MEGFEQFVGVNFWTMIFAWCNLIILYLVLRKILFRPIMKMIDTRQQEIDDTYRRADDYLEDARADREQYEQKLAQVKQEGEEYMKQTVKRAHQREDEILRQAQQRADDKLERAREQIELERRQAVNDVKDQAAQLALAVAEAVIEREVDEDEHAEMIDSFIRELADDAGETDK